MRERAGLDAVEDVTSELGLVDEPRALVEQWRGIRVEASREGLVDLAVPFDAVDERIDVGDCSAGGVAARIIQSGLAGARLDIALRAATVISAVVGGVAADTLMEVMWADRHYYSFDPP